MFLSALVTELRERGVRGTVDLYTAFSECAGVHAAYLDKAAL